MRRFAEMSNRSGIMSLLAILLLVFAVACGGGADSQSAPVGHTPDPGTADLLGQLTQDGGDRVVSQDGPGLPGAYVTLINTLSGGVLGVDMTDSVGRFEFRGVPSGDNYLVKIEFQSTEDLDGDGELDEIELFYPISLADQAVVEMLQEIGIADLDNDGQMDSLEVLVELSDDQGRSETDRSQLRRRDGEHRRDNNGNGDFDDDPAMDDDEGDGLPDAGSPDALPGDGEILEIEIRGLLEDITADEILIGGVTLMITESTRFKLNGMDTTWESFSSGMYVQVEGISDGLGGWFAHEVSAESEEVEGEELEVQGEIEEITEETITVAGVMFYFDEDTEWKLNGEDATPGDFALGMFVKVEGQSDGMGGWIADEIKTSDEESLHRKVVLGIIQDLTDAEIVVDGVVFAINSDTEWKLKGNKNAGAEDFEVGQRVQVKGMSDGAGGWIAERVKDKSFGQGEHGEDFELTGEIEALTDSTITVKGVEFAFDDSTEWELDGEDAAPADFAVGMEVEVKAHSDGNNGWIADEVEGESMDVETIEVSGLIEELTETTLTVDGVLFGFDPETMWLINELMADPGNFDVGMEVTVAGHADGLGGWIADEVSADSEIFEETLELSGEIEELTESTIIVDGTAFRILPGTSWMADGDEASKDDFAVGMFVNITGFADGAGGWYADMVEAAEPPLVTLIDVRGFIDEITEDTISVAGFTFDFDETTVWTLLGASADPGDFFVGDYVVVGAHAESGGWFAHSVEDQPAGPLELLDARGTLEEISEDYIVVSGIMFGFDPAIEWMIDGQPAAPEDFAVGMDVRAEAHADELGNWIAHLVESPIPEM